MLLVFLPSVEGLCTKALHRAANQTVNWENQTNKLSYPQGIQFYYTLFSLKKNLKGALVVPKKIALDHKINSLCLEKIPTVYTILT